MRLPLTVLPTGGFGGQIASAAAAGSAANMVPSASIAVAICFMVSSPFISRHRGTGRVPG